MNKEMGWFSNCLYLYIDLCLCGGKACSRLRKKIFISDLGCLLATLNVIHFRLNSLINLIISKRERTRHNVSLHKKTCVCAHTQVFLWRDTLCLVLSLLLIIRLISEFSLKWITFNVAKRHPKSEINIFFLSLEHAFPPQRHKSIYKYKQLLNQPISLFMITSHFKALAVFIFFELNLGLWLGSHKSIFRWNTTLLLMPDWKTFLVNLFT